MAGEPVRIPGYDEFVEIGRGGFAVVYRARQTRLRRLVAVKVLNASDASDTALARFEHECAAVGALSGHPNVVAVHDAGTTEDGRPYLAMEYLPAGSLAQRLAAGPLPVGEALAMGSQLADALAAAHAAEILHRDVKPENVLLDAAGTPKLADFGIAIVADAHQTATGVVIGTVMHSAPEVLQGDRATVAADVYSLASTLFTAVNGRAAFAGPHDEGVGPVMYRVVHGPVPDLRPAGVPSPAAALLETGMAKDPVDRFRSAAAFRRAIEGTAEMVAPGAIRAPVAGPPTPSPVVAPAPGTDRAADAPTVVDPPPQGSRGLVTGLVIAIVILLAVVVVGALVLRDDDSDAPTTTTADATTAPAEETTEPATASTETPTSPPDTPSTPTPTPSSTPTPTPSTAPPGPTTLPPATTVDDAVARVKRDHPDVTIVDSSLFRLDGASALLGQGADGRYRAYLFGDGQLLGPDTADGSLSMEMVDATGDTITLRFDLWPAGQGPPDASTESIDVRLQWDGDARFVPVEGDFPPADSTVDGHR